MLWYKSFGSVPYISLLCDNIIIFISSAEYQPHISEAEIPSFNAVKSIKNITRERSWRPLYEKDLANILYFYKSDQVDSGYQANDEFHMCDSRPNL